MKRLPASSVQHRWWLLVAFASMAGGLAEIAWVSFYGVLTSTNIAEVARQVTVSFSHELGETPMAVPLGVLIHLALALVMGCAYALLIWQPFARRAGKAATLLSAALALAAVWAVNFFVLLPALNPAFVALLPYVVTFASKMWFALALAGVLIAGNSRSRKQASSYDRTSERSEQGFLFGLRPFADVQDARMPRRPGWPRAASIRSAKPQTGHPWPAALASIRSAKPGRSTPAPTRRGVTVNCRHNQEVSHVGPHIPAL